MISLSLFLFWAVVAMIFAFIIEEEDLEFTTIFLASLFIVLFSLIWIIPFFTGMHIENNKGQYTGYVTAIEENGVIFKGMNIYLKSELSSSNEEMACINKNNKELIGKLSDVQKNKKNVTLEYMGVMQFGIGECPKSDWMVVGIVE